MKSLKPLLLILALAISLGGCAYLPDQNGDEDKTTEYLNTIATLEATLSAERASFAKVEAEYKQAIATLEEKVAQLTANQAPTQESEDSVKFHYRTENGNAVITGYEGSVALLTIPDTLDGYPVISIGERAFEGANVTAVVLPNTLVEIGWFAFYNCHSLLNVTIPPTVTSIGYAVFDGCGALTVYGSSNSYAERYARSYGLSFVAN